MAPSFVQSATRDAGHINQLKIVAFPSGGERIAKASGASINPFTQGTTNVTIDGRWRRHRITWLPPQMDMRVAKGSHRSVKLDTQHSHLGITPAIRRCSRRLNRPQVYSTRGEGDQKLPPLYRPLPFRCCTFGFHLGSVCSLRRGILVPNQHTASIESDLSIR